MCSRNGRIKVLSQPGRKLFGAMVFLLVIEKQTELDADGAWWQFTGAVRTSEHTSTDLGGFGKKNCTEESEEGKQVNSKSANGGNQELASHGTFTLTFELYLHVHY